MRRWEDFSWIVFERRDGEVPIFNKLWVSERRRDQGEEEVRTRFSRTEEERCSEARKVSRFFDIVPRRLFRRGKPSFDCVARSGGAKRRRVRITTKASLFT